MFKNRFEAGRKLAIALKHYHRREAVVVAVPRGGVQTGYAVAMELQLPLEVVLTKKLGHPLYKQFAIGGVSLEDLILSPDCDTSEKYIEEETRHIREMLRNRYQLYCGDRRSVDLHDRIVIMVDDGAVTGSTLLASVELVRKAGPRWVVVAVPVAPPEVARFLMESKSVDELVCLSTPEDFYAVEQYYETFEQVTDEEVVELLEKANREPDSSLSSGS